MAKPTAKISVNIANGKPSYIAFDGDMGWYDRAKTEVTAVTDTKFNWGFNKKPKFIGTDKKRLVVILHSKGPKEKTIPDVGTITVTFTADVNPAPDPVPVTYVDDSTA